MIVAGGGTYKEPRNSALYGLSISIYVHIVTAPLRQPCLAISFPYAHHHQRGCQAACPTRRTTRLSPRSSLHSRSLASRKGAHCTIQTLYEGRSRCFCCKNWVKEYPKDLRTAMEEQAGTKQKALVARMAKNHGDGKPLVLNSIVVQSSSLRKTLEEVFQGYRGITASLKKLVFKAPFHPFYYRWGGSHADPGTTERGRPGCSGVYGAPVWFARR